MKQTAEEFYSEKNNGKSAEESTKHGELITPNYAVALMEQYASKFPSEEEISLKAVETYKRKDGKVIRGGGFLGFIKGAKWVIDWLKSYRRDEDKD